MLAELYVLTGRDAGKGLNAGAGPTIFVGRAATNHIRVRDPLASRVHCRIDVTQDGLVLHDNHSGNGTFVNGLRVAGPRQLDDEDEIQLGETRIKVLIERTDEANRWDRSDASSGGLDDSIGGGGDPLSSGSSIDLREADGPDATPRRTPTLVITPSAADAALQEESDGEPATVSGLRLEGATPSGGADSGDELSESSSIRPQAEASATGVIDPLSESSGDRPIPPDPTAPRGPAAAGAAPAAAREKRRSLREVLPGYRIETRLGGHSHDGVAVYRALQVSLDRPVALKVLLPKGADGPRGVDRFVRAAKAIARLPHPNIVTIHDVVARGKLRVLVMELLAGGSLADRLEAGPLDVEETLRVAESVASALAYAHAHGVIHRAVKPSNVLYAQEHLVYKLADFGLATDHGGTRSGDTQLIDLPPATVAYMAPELLAAASRGEPDDRRSASSAPEGPKSIPQAGRAGRVDPLADPRVDVYALGATLHACLSGAPPFVGSSVGVTSAAVLRDPPPTLPRAPGPLATLITRCLSKDPASRYPDGAALLHEVRACLAAGSQWSAVDA
jgi:hypothetical protein